MRLLSALLVFVIINTVYSKNINPIQNDYITEIDDLKYEIEEIDTINPNGPIQLEDLLRTSLAKTNGNALQHLKRKRRFLGAILSIGSAVWNVGKSIFGMKQQHDQTRAAEKSNEILGNIFEQTKKNGEETNQNFQKTLEAIDKNYAAINRNYEAINNVAEKVDRNFVALKGVSDLVGNVQKTIETIRQEMNAGFNKVLERIRDLEVKPILSKISAFIQEFFTEKDKIKSLSQSEYLTKLKEPNGILDRLKDYRTTKADSLQLLLHSIIDQNHAIPKDSYDEIGFAALDALYYGTQTYLTSSFFVIDQYSYLANFHYLGGDLKEYNNYFDLTQITFQDFKQSVTGTENVNVTVIDSVIAIFQEVKTKKFIKESLLEELNKKQQSLVDLKNQILNMALPMIADTPTKITGTPEFSKDGIKTPLGEWKDGAKVSYAFQYSFNNTYSKIGEWSDVMTVSGKANPIIRVPVDAKRRIRIIFRKFNNDNPQLVGILTDVYQTEFRDIDRDLYNAAQGFDKVLAYKEFEILLNAGAKVDAVFDNGRKAIHAAAIRNNDEIAQDFLINTTDINSKDSNGYTPLHIAAEAGHNAFINLLIAHGAEVNPKTETEGLTPLHIAAYKGYDSTIKALLSSNKVDLNAKDSEGFTPLHSAAFGGLPAIETLIGSNRVNLNIRSEGGLTPLHLSTMNNYLDIVQVLLKHANIQVNSEADGNFTSLHFAAILGHHDIARSISGIKGANVNAKLGDNNFTPLHFAISLEKEDVIPELLKNNGIDVNAAAVQDITPLHLAAGMAPGEIVENLLEAGAVVDKQTEDGFSALHIAARSGNLRAVTALINKNASLELKTNEGYTALLEASSSEKGKPEIIKFLIEKGADVKAITPTNENYAWLGAKSGNKDIVEFLINNHGADAEDDNGNSYIHFAVSGSNFKVVKYLIEEKGVFVNLRNNAGERPLHLAAKAGDFETVKYLIEERRSNVNAPGAGGKALLQYAVESGNLDLVKYLIEESKLDVNVLTPQNENLLHLSVLHGHLDLVKYLIAEKQLDINVLTATQESILHYAAKFNHLDIVKYLIEDKQMNINAINAGLQTALHFASANGNMNMTQYLVEKGIIIEAETTATPLLNALSNKHFDIAKYLVEKGADGNHFTAPPSPLELAATENNFELIKLMLEKGKANLNNLGAYDISPLKKSVLNEDFDLVKFFVEAGENINEQDKVNNTALHFASEKNNLEIMKYLVRKGGNLGIQNSEGKVPLDFANKNNANIVTKLNRNINLFAAVVAGNLELVQNLINEGADVEFRNDAGMTPLHYVASKDLIEVAKILVNEGANLKAKDNNGKTALEIARETNSIHVINFLDPNANIPIPTEPPTEAPPAPTEAPPPPPPAPQAISEVVESNSNQKFLPKRYSFSEYNAIRADSINFIQLN